MITLLTNSQYRRLMMKSTRKYYYILFLTYSLSQSFIQCSTYCSIYSSQKVLYHNLLTNSSGKLLEKVFYPTLTTNSYIMVILETHNTKSLTSLTQQFLRRAQINSSKKVLLQSVIIIFYTTHYDSIRNLLYHTSWRSYYTSKYYIKVLHQSIMILLTTLLTNSLYKLLRQSYYTNSFIRGLTKSYVKLYHYSYNIYCYKVLLQSYSIYS